MIYCRYSLVRIVSVVSLRHYDPLKLAGTVTRGRWPPGRYTVLETTFYDRIGNSHPLLKAFRWGMVYSSISEV